MLHFSQLLTRRITLGLTAAVLLTAAMPATLLAEDANTAKPWVVFEGKEGPGKGKHVVFVTGDDEYFSEEGMPVMARILAEHHGFTPEAFDTFTAQLGDGRIDTTDHGLRSISGEVVAKQLMKVLG